MCALRTACECRSCRCSRRNGFGCACRGSSSGARGDCGRREHCICGRAGQQVFLLLLAAVAGVAGRGAVAFVGVAVGVVVGRGTHAAVQARGCLAHVRGGGGGGGSGGRCCGGL